jgi:SOS-response transcriptional repressor LexA
MAWARVHGALLEGLGVRHDDHVALERTDRAEHGDLAAVADPSGRAALWRVYPEGRRLRLSTGDPAHARTTGPDPRVHGVVVGVLRKFSVAAATSRARPAGGESEAPSAHLPA